MQAVFAKKAGFTRAYLRKLETGQIGVTVDTLLHLAKVFDFSLQTFMEQVEKRRTEFTERAFDFDFEMREGGIMVITRVGTLDISKEVEFIKRVYSFCRGEGACKVLFNLAATKCDFSKQEEWDCAVAIVEWLGEQSYWPVVAVVRNVTLGEHGAQQAQRDGLNVKLFSTMAEARDWLKKEPPDPRCCVGAAPYMVRDAP